MFSRILVVFLFLWVGATAPLQAQTVTRGPYLQQGTDSGLIVRWRTDQNTDSVVRYGTTAGNLNQTASIGGSRTEHSVQVSGLASDTRYYYSVGTNGGPLAGDSSYRFTTSPPGLTPKQTRIWVVGDSGTANADARAVRDAYKNFTGSREEELWLMLGDNAYNDGTDSQYQAAVFNTYPEILRRAVVWSARGNHDRGNPPPYYDIFTFPTNGEAGGVASGTEAYYSFDYGNIHFISLDSYISGREPGNPMLTWLENDLQAVSSEWIIVFFHHPPYTKGSHDSDSTGDSGGRMVDMRENVLPILEQYGVDLVLSGHSHSYERSYLLDGHYDFSWTLDPSMILDNGSGRDDNTGAYQKPDSIGAPNAGAVYAVAGSSGKVTGSLTQHPAMYSFVYSLGSMVLDIDNGELDATFIDENGAVLDYFTIRKYGGGGNNTTIAFQDGVAPTGGYNGTRDAYIREASATTAHGLEATLQVDGDEPSGTGQDMSALLEWDVSAVPGSATVESARIVLEVTNPSPGSYELYGLNRSWTESQVTWNQASSGVNWGIPGAEAGSDRDGAVLGAINAPAVGRYQITLNAAGVALVQGWVSGGTANHGVILSNTSTTDGVDMHSRQAGSAGVRPRLEITYSDNTDTEPPSVPTNLQATNVTDSSVSLSWNASIDNVGVAGYRIYRNGVEVGTSGNTSFTDTGLQSNTSYSYEVSAYDAAGNESAHSQGISVTTNGLNVTIAFQDGVSPNGSYSGTRDAYIREASATTAHGLEAALQVDGDEPAGSGQDMNVLLEWDISAIPFNAQIESAAIILEVTNPSNGSYEFYGLNRNWTESQVTWNQASSGANWGSPGAEAGSDRDGTVLGAINAPATGTYQVTLNAAGIALVQGWVSGSLSNHGVILSNTSTTNGADFHAHEAGSVGVRPRLEVTYTEGAGMTVVGEAGNTSNDSGNWKTINLNNSYKNPVVIIGPPSFAGGQPTAMRVRNVTNSSFQLKLDEWEYLDGGHLTEAVPYLVVEAGRHTLADGTVIEAGILPTVNQNWDSGSYSQSFAQAPVVLVQVSSENDAQTVTHRLDNVDANGFIVKLEEEEAADDIHANEVVGWVAIETGAGGDGGQSWLAGNTGNNVTHLWKTISFSPAFGSAPVFLAAMQTFDGGDTSALRHRNLGGSSVQIFVEEEQSANTEINHTTEDVGYMAISAGDLIGN